MKETEILQILIAILTLAIISGFNEIINFEIAKLGMIILFAAIIICANILGKKLMAHHLDADVENEIWKGYRFGMKPSAHLKKAIPAGIIFPIFITAISLGAVKLMTIMTYETKALKRRAAKRFGPFSFTELTDFHNALIGAAGIVLVLAISFASYWFTGFEPLAKLAAFYAFFNMIPFSKLDGSQIFFGSRVLWATLAIITLIFTSYALLLI